MWLAWRLAALGAIAGVIVAIGLWITYLVMTPRQFDMDAIANANRIPGMTYLDAYGELLATRGAYHGDPVTLEELPPYLVNAFLATEDRRFYRHYGVDPRGIARALFVNWRAGRLVQGGSTITQQLAKNLFLNGDRTANRKFREVLYAVWLERHLTKDEILALYLNRIYMGAGTYGVGAAAEFYFDKKAGEVTLAEAAMLAGLPKAPTKYSPKSNLESAQTRAADVLKNLVEARYLKKDEIAEALENPAQLDLADRAQLHALQYFFDYVHELLPTLIDQVDEDLVITTTLDTRLQHKAEGAMAGVFKENGDAALLKVGQGALIAYGPDGAVRAMVGGRSYTDSQFNRSVQAMRQPGSAFKPFVYVAALEKGFSPDDILVDEPVKIGTWEPTNYAGTYAGRVTLRQALAGSINTVAAQLIEQVSPETVVETASRLGIRSNLPAIYSLALGTAQVSLEELTGAFLAFPNEGLSVSPHAILRIETSLGEVRYEYEAPQAEQVMTREIAREMNGMMYQVIQSGTGRRARLGGRPAAGKTGTSQDWRDAWFVGYTHDLVAGVWVGNDDESPMERVTGGGLPAQIWKDFMLAAHEGVKVSAIPGAMDRRDPRQANELRSFYGDLIGDFAQVRGGAPAASSSAGRPGSDDQQKSPRRGRTWKWPWE